MEKPGIGLMLSGLLLMVGAEKDLLSIIMRCFELYFVKDFHISFLSSFGFRVLMMTVGGILLVFGGLIYRKYIKE